MYDIPYVGKFWRGKIFANLANGAQFAKFFCANSYKYSEIRPASRFAKIFLAICFISNDSPKFSPFKFFPRTVDDKC